MTTENNIFEHICYEFDMYTKTFFEMIKITEKRTLLEQEIENINIQNQYNICWDAHFLHMRNVTDFFKNKKHKTDIIVDTVIDCLKSNICSFKDGELEYKDENGKNIIKKDGKLLDYSTVINKSVEHLTLERISGLTPNIPLKNMQIQTINNMIVILVEHIKSFLALLDDENNIKNEYRDNLKKYKPIFDSYKIELHKMFPTK